MRNKLQKMRILEETVWEFMFDLLPDIPESKVLMTLHVIAAYVLQLIPMSCYMGLCYLMGWGISKLVVSGTVILSSGPESINSLIGAGTMFIGFVLVVAAEWFGYEK